MDKNKEIKIFRGKDSETKEWVYGYLVKNFTGRCFILNGNDENIQNNFQALHRKIFSTECFYEVVPKTIGQYIGLKDKNNKFIYEGDIMLYTDTNWGYGGEYDKIHDGYLRIVVPNIKTLLKEYSDDFTDQVQFWESICNKRYDVADKVFIGDRKDVTCKRCKKKMESIDEDGCIILR